MRGAQKLRQPAHAASHREYYYFRIIGTRAAKRSMSWKILNITAAALATHKHIQSRADVVGAIFTRKNVALLCKCAWWRASFGPKLVTAHWHLMRSHSARLIYLLSRQLSHGAGEIMRVKILRVVQCGPRDADMQLWVTHAPHQIRIKKMTSYYKNKFTTDSIKANRKIMLKILLDSAHFIKDKQNLSVHIKSPSYANIKNILIAF